MAITIENIADHEYFEYKGDVIVTGNIGTNANVIIKDGSLTVHGNVGDSSSITLSKESRGGG